jgi:hypothetical protein
MELSSTGVTFGEVDKYLESQSKAGILSSDLLCKLKLRFTFGQIIKKKNNI